VIKVITGIRRSGKSTFLKTLSGLVRPTQGCITFMNQNIQGLAPEKIVAAGIAHVPEGRNVFARQTVMTNLQIGAFIRKDTAEIQKDIKRFFEIFPILGERCNQLAGTLSGGEQQMLAIARGLMARPKLLLLDEPSMGLAPILVNEIFGIIRQLHEEGIAIVVVEQNVKKALKITQRAYVMELGKILYHGDSKDLMADDRVRKCYLGEA